MLQGDRRQVFWPTMSRRTYGASHVNTAVQNPGVASSANRGVAASFLPGVLQQAQADISQSL